MRSYAPLLLLTLSVNGVWAGPAAAELALDRSAVTDLINAGLPEHHEVDVPGWGSVTLELGRLDTVEFVDGGIEGRLRVGVEGLDVAALVMLRLVPDVEPTTGVVGLRPVAAVAEWTAGLTLDLAEHLEPVRLPRRLEWELPWVEGAPVELLCFVQGVRVGDQRVWVDLGLVSRPLNRWNTKNTLPSSKRTGPSP